MAPQLFETTDRPVTPRSNSDWINMFGTPFNPNPPTANDAPVGTSDTASRAVPTTLSMRACLS